MTASQETPPEAGTQPAQHAPLGRDQAYPGGHWLSGKHMTPSQDTGGGGGHEGQHAPGFTIGGPSAQAIPGQATFSHEHTGQHWPGGVTS